jgi:hypothetical protein
VTTISSKVPEAAGCWAFEFMADAMKMAARAPRRAQFGILSIGISLDILVLLEYQARPR